MYLGKEDKRQGITRNPETNVLQRIGEAGRYASSRKTGITSTENKLIQYAEEALQEALVKTNAFFTSEWATYRSSLEKIDNSPFKETKIIAIK